ncbi:DUF5687 family protein [Algoriphagus sediminis]|uniref:DUF5687 family protein n=1 Tax=Algoriphagus sediminis TaxID=3057113 RepID=A0ABT7YG29_9BACT|nr:DUF5687 family protein [Algoriphagus sediminis]MDN3205487.1 DUF5687 family protein [Algoriphagus sediminis]
MIFELIRLQWLKAFRSTSFGKSAAISAVLIFLAALLLLYVLLAGLFLSEIIDKVAEGQDPLELLNSWLIYFFLGEFMYRYFIQKLPVIELESLLHLPIGKRRIIHMLLVRSFVSPLNIIALLLFLPFSISHVAEVNGGIGMLGWLGLILSFSWTLHWFMLWFKQRFEDSFIGLVVVFAVLLMGGGLSYMGWFNVGEWVAPMFTLASTSLIPFFVFLALCIGMYFITYNYYLNNAYLEDLSEEEEIRFANQSLGFLSRFGDAGEMANLEWKLIIRHKKSRTYLMLSAFFLLYGLIFYTNPVYQSEGINFIFIFVGVFITGIFMIQYGQLFLSWNSANFDFFVNRKDGLESLVKGKYLLFVAISILCFVCSVPYAYFGWKFLFIHFVTFLFNIGILMHVIIYLALWKPKPMDLNKGAMFNYEGVGAAQFLMIIPMMILPYVIYLPFAFLVSEYAGLIALGVLGAVGIVFFKPLMAINLKRLLAQRYEISSSFRQEV